VIASAVLVVFFRIWHLAMLTFKKNMLNTSRKSESVPFSLHGSRRDLGFLQKGLMHIRLMSNVRLYFAFYALNFQKKAQNKFLLHNKAKNFVSLQVLKTIILSSLQKTAKC